MCRVRRSSDEDSVAHTKADDTSADFVDGLTAFVIKSDFVHDSVMLVNSGGI